MIKDVRDALCLGILLSVTAFLVTSAYLGNVVPPEPQHRAQHQAEESNKHNNPNVTETFWQKTTSDPVAFFTFCLMAFTAVLAASTIGLWLVTKAASVKQSSDMSASIAVARTSADVAKQALEVVERAYLTVDPRGINPWRTGPAIVGHVTIRNAGRSEWFIYVWGIVRYTDGFGEDCFTKFCHRYPVTPKTIERHVVSSEYARFHEHGNDAERPRYQKQPKVTA